MITSNKLEIIGLAGTNGSGKDTVGEMLAEKHGYLFVSVSDLLRVELKRRGLPIERENLRTLSAGWRRESGLGVLVIKAVEFYEQQKANYKGIVMASLRNPGEADEIHKLGGTLVWVDADPKVRYNRVFSRQRTAEDRKTFEQFIAEEQAEMQHNGDEATLNMSAVKEKADITLLNDGNDISAFKKYAEKVLNLT